MEVTGAGANRLTLNRDEQIVLHVRFKGGAGKTLQLPLPLCAWQQRITP